jgi:hypothetical protein
MCSPLRIACVFLHVERGRSSKRVGRSPRITFFFVFTDLLLFFFHFLDCSSCDRMAMGGSDEKTKQLHVGAVSMLDVHRFML